MLKITLITLLLTFSLNAQTYCAGEQISLADQNLTHLVGAGYHDYEVGDDDDGYPD